jgi:hypothetical protein
LPVFRDANDGHEDLRPLRAGSWGISTIEVPRIIAMS